MTKHSAHRMFKLRLANLTISCFLTLLLTPLHAENSWTIESGTDKKNLIELFTSQGCSSCPPAEAFMNDLKNAPGLWEDFVPLAFHVDYWDYIGWEDPFAKKAFSSRQKEHRLLSNIKSVYTPGWVVDGKEWRGFFKRQPLPSITQTAPQLKSIFLSDKVIILTSPNLLDRWGATQINIAVMGGGFQHEIKKGENKGLALASEFVVLQHDKHPIKRPSPWTINLPDVPKTEAENHSFAIWLSDANQTPIQAIGGWIDNQWQPVNGTTNRQQNQTPN